jgi:hypothetical protein
MTLVLHAGGAVATMEQVQACPVPEQVGRYHPVPHDKVLDTVRETLHGAGFEPTKERLALSHQGKRFFAVLDLKSGLAEGVSLSVGIRNSLDKSFPLGFAAGSRVFVCDNLAFNAELLVRRRHTLNGMRNFGNGIAQAVGSLGSYMDSERLRIENLMVRTLTPLEVDHTILSAFRKGIISSVQIEKVCTEWEKPRHEEFAPRTAWSLLNAFTEVLKPRAVKNPEQFVAATIRLNGMLTN